MIRIAICGHEAAGRIRLRDALEHYAAELEISNVAAVQFPSNEAFERAADRMRPGFFGLCFCRIGDSAEAESSKASTDADEPCGLAAARRVRQAHPELRMVLVSAEKSHAIFAYDLDAGFLLASGSFEDFERAVADPLAEMTRTRGAVASVRSGNGIENIVLEDIQFVESSKRGPIIHLPAGRAIPVRGTLQALYETLKESCDKRDMPGDDKANAADCGERGRFVKAGSSFIVNLDNVRSAGEGSLIFADGEAIIVPVRKRKAVLDALQSYWLRS